MQGFLGFKWFCAGIKIGHRKGFYIGKFKLNDSNLCSVVFQIVVIRIQHMLLFSISKKDSYYII